MKSSTRSWLTPARSFALMLLLAPLFLGRGFTEPAPGVEARTMTWDKLERTYLLAVPPAGPGGKRALVMGFHGGGGTAENQMSRIDGGRMLALSREQGFVYCCPQGVDKHWNDGRKDTSMGTQKNIDDIGFSAALIDALVAELDLDPARVYATGISNGGMISHRLAFEHPEKIAAIAPVASAIPVELLQLEAPRGPVAVLAINGRQDPLVPWDGGKIGLLLRDRGDVCSVSQTVQTWGRVNGCNLNAPREWLPNSDPRDLTRVWKKAFKPRAGGKPVVLYGIEGGGHTWPSGQQYLPQWIIGRVSRDLVASDVIWEFFKAQTLK